MYWLETQLCLFGTLQLQQTFAHAGLISSSFLVQYKSASDLQRTRISFVLDCFLSEHLVVVLGNQVEHNSTGNYVLVLDPTAFHLYKTNSHGSLRLVCSGFEGCYLA